MQYKTIRKRVSIRRLVKAIDNYCKKHSINEIIAIPIMTGAMQLTVELLKKFSIENGYRNAILPIIVSSYIANEVKGNIKMKYFDTEKFIELTSTDTNRLVLIIDDIVDTGETLEYVYFYLTKLVRKSNIHIKTAALIVKNTTKFWPDFYQYEDINNEWYVGYGMDDNDFNRITNGLYAINK